MVGAPGIYLVYRRYHGAGGQETKRLVGRFAILGQDVKILEDHDGVLSDALPQGKLSAQHLKTILNFQMSPYWSLVSDRDVSEGHHEEEIPDLELQPKVWPAE